MTRIKKLRGRLTDNHAKNWCKPMWIEDCKERLNTSEFNFVFNNGYYNDKINFM